MSARRPPPPDEAALNAVRGLVKRHGPDVALEAFALIRALPDAALITAIAPPAPAAAPRRRTDPLAADVAAILGPILGPVSEKAELLLEHMAEADPQVRDELLQPPKGLADGVRRLRKRFSDEEIRAGAHGLIARLARSHSMRETLL